MEQSPNEKEQSVFTKEEEAEIVAQAQEGATSAEEVMKNTNRIVAERMQAKTKAAADARIVELQNELKSQPEPAVETAPTAPTAGAQKLEEAQELVKAELPWYQRMFRRDSSYQETGTSRQTKAGQTVSIVAGPDGKQYVKLVEYRGGGGDPGHQSTKNYYIPVEKAESFLQ